MSKDSRPATKKFIIVNGVPRVVSDSSEDGKQRGGPDVLRDFCDRNPRFWMTLVFLSTVFGVITGIYFMASLFGLVNING